MAPWEDPLSGRGLEDGAEPRTSLGGRGGRAPLSPALQEVKAAVCVEDRPGPKTLARPGNGTWSWASLTKCRAGGDG